MTGHVHDLDGRLHTGCPMCDDARARTLAAKADEQVARALDRYHDIAVRRPDVEVADLCRWCGHHETWHRPQWGCERGTCPCPNYKGGPS